MDDDDYLADLIKKVKQAKKETRLDKARPKKAALKAEIPKEVESIKKEPVKPVPEQALEKLEKPVVEEGISGKPVAPTPKPVKKLLEEEETHGTVPKELADEKSTVEKELEAARKKKTLASYGDVKIISVPGKPLPYYTIPVARPTRQEKAVINTIKEAATRLIAITPYKIRDLQQKRAVYKQHIIDILKNSPELHIPERRFEFYAESVVREMVGYGIIDPLVMDDDLEEIMVVGAKKPVFLFHRKYEMLSSNIEFYSDKEIIDLINRIARNVGRRVDISNPLLDARLADGSRVNATIPPASVNGATITIRKFRKDPYTVTDLINSGTMSSEVAAFLWLCVEGMGAKPANILISGGTSSGKTTTLNCLASFIPETERVVTIEDTAELDLPLKHWVRMESRPPGLEGRGELTIDILTKNSLRMRPDRIIVGEVRHDEAFTLFTALNTGHDGCLGTIHANSAQETIVRVTSPPMNVPQVMLAGLDFIIIEHKIHDKRKGTIRRITEIAEISGVLLKKAQTQTIFARDAAKDTIERTNVPIKFLKILENFTGASRKAIEADWKARKDYLEDMQRKNITKLAEVKKALQKYNAGVA
jgi:flagellar protein FlaI